MIKYRPRRKTPSASAKEEQTFKNIGEMFEYLYDNANRIMVFIGSAPVKKKDIMIDGNRKVLISRYSKMLCIGEYEE